METLKPNERVVYVIISVNTGMDTKCSACEFFKKIISHNQRFDEKRAVLASFPGSTSQLFCARSKITAYFTTCEKRLGSRAWERGYISLLCADIYITLQYTVTI